MGTYEQVKLEIIKCMKIISFFDSNPTYSIYPFENSGRAVKQMLDELNIPIKYILDDSSGGGKQYHFP